MRFLNTPQALCVQFLLVTFCFLQVLETCVNNCGDRFHSEMAKFRFLNELIKVLSPKVGDGGYRVFQDKKCSSALSEAVRSAGRAPLPWGRLGPA